MTKLADKGNWDEDFVPNDNSDKQSDDQGEDRIPFMTFPESGKAYHVRLVGAHVKYLEYWKPFRAITHPDYKNKQNDDDQKDPAWKAGWYAPKKFAIHIIDREDNTLKVLNKGNTIFEKFAEFRAVHGINPAGKVAPDFIIIPTIPKGKDGQPDKMKTKYKVDAAREDSPLTDEEVAMYKEKKINLQERYKATSLEKIKEMWDALSDSEKIAPPSPWDKKDSEKKNTQSSTPAAPIEETMADAPAESNDDFVEAGADAGDAGDTDSTELF